MNLNSWLSMIGLGTSTFSGGKGIGTWIGCWLLFSGGLAFSWTTWLDGPTVSQNRENFEQMDARSKKELMRKWERFQSLSEPEQQRYRAFHQRLNEHENAAELKVLLNRYANWIVTIESTTRGRIKEANMDQKISLIQEARIKQYIDNAGKDEKTRLSMKDAKVLRDWQSTLPRRRGWVVEADELDRLQAALSPEPQKLMAQFATGNIGLSGDEERDDLRNQLVRNWIMRTQWVPPNDQQLQEIYANLSEQEKEELVDLDGDPRAIKFKLVEFYYRQLGVDRGPRRPPQ